MSVRPVGGSWFAWVASLSKAREEARRMGSGRWQRGMGLLPCVDGVTEFYLHPDNSTSVNLAPEPKPFLCLRATLT